MTTNGTNSDSLLESAAIDGVYVVHWTALTDRLKNVAAQLKTAGMTVNIVTGWDPEEFRDADMRCLFPSSALFDKLAKMRHWGTNWFRLGELSLCVKHLAAFYDAVRRGHRNVLVLEDDFSVAPNFKQQLLEMMSRRSEWEDPGRPFDIVFVGSFRSNDANESSLQPKTVLNDDNQGAIGYVISSRGMSHVLANLPITAPADHMISNNMMRTAPPNRYVHRPYLVEPETDFGELWKVKRLGKSLANPKKSHWVRTPDILDCVGTQCTCAPANVSALLIEAGCCCESAKVP